MKILFIARNYLYVRNFDSGLRELARRGHTIHFAVEKTEGKGVQAGPVERLAREYPSFTYGPIPETPFDERRILARRLRLGLDYLRYLDPFYDTAPLRRVRARERTPRGLIALAAPPVVAGAAWRKVVGRWLHRLDLAIEPPPATLDYIRSQRPDVVLVTPLVDLGSQQIDYVRAARSLGIPTALCVWSWDHLSSKALLREYPERVIVWNPTQRREAIEVHGVPADRVVVTGAQCFDHWFDRRPSRTRDAFCREVGLPVDRPLVLYVGTGLISGSPPEPVFAREWLEALRRSRDPHVAGAAVLFRPHPSQPAGWDMNLDALGPAVVWGGSNPIDEQSRADYFDSLYHASAVVGLNTSAFIEAGIVGRPVLAVLPDRFHDNQEGTVHFRYLLEIGGGLLRVSRDLASHAAQLADALALGPSDEHPHKVFIESFVRPQGIGTAATPAFVAAVEQLQACRVVASTAAAPWLGGLVSTMARVSGRPWAEPLAFSPREFANRAEHAQKARRERRRREGDLRVAAGEKKVTRA